MAEVTDPFDDDLDPVWPDPPDDDDEGAPAWPDDCDGGYEAFYELWDDLAGSAW